MRRVIQWATKNNDVRAVLLTSSLASAIASFHESSDLDIELGFDDIDPYQLASKWVLEFGNPITMAEEDETFHCPGSWYREHFSYPLNRLFKNPNSSTSVS